MSGEDKLTIRQNPTAFDPLARFADVQRAENDEFLAKPATERVLVGTQLRSGRPVRHVLGSRRLPFGKEKARELGASLNDSYVISKKGIGCNPMNPTILSKEFTTFSQMNGFNCTFHDLRHTFATYAIAAGIDIATVASYLGHANISITLNTYATVDPDAKRAAAATIEKVIGYAS